MGSFTVKRSPILTLNPGGPPVWRNVGSSTLGRASFLHFLLRAETDIGANDRPRGYGLSDMRKELAGRRTRHRLQTRQPVLVA